jgi:hypothetical protein
MKLNPSAPLLADLMRIDWTPLLEKESDKETVTAATNMWVRLCNLKRMPGGSSAVPMRYVDRDAFATRVWKGEPMTTSNKRMLRTMLKLGFFESFEGSYDKYSLSGNSGVAVYGTLLSSFKNLKTM